MKPAYSIPIYSNASEHVLTYLKPNSYLISFRTVNRLDVGKRNTDLHFSSIGCDGPD